MRWMALPRAIASLPGSQDRDPRNNQPLTAAGRKENRLYCSHVMRAGRSLHVCFEISNAMEAISKFLAVWDSCSSAKLHGIARKI